MGIQAIQPIDDFSSESSLIEGGASQEEGHSAQVGRRANTQYIHIERAAGRHHTGEISGPVDDRVEPGRDDT